MNDLAVVIPFGGLSSRILFCPKSLINLENGETILNRHIRLVKNTFPDSEIYVTVGFRKEKVRKSCNVELRWVENNDFESTNVAHSIGLALKKVPKDKNVLIIYGDLIYSKSTLELIPFSSGSQLLIDSSKEKYFKKDEVGLSSKDCTMINMSYGLDIKWAQIAFIENKDRKKIDDEFTRIGNERLFGFEIFNKAEVKLKAINTTNVIEVDSYKDLIKANEFIRGNN